MLRVQVILMILVSLLMSACQTSMLKQFSELKPGMEKDDVLNLMGSPNQTQRFHGKDRWKYVFYDQRIRFEKEIQFFEGSAVYIGDPWQPEASQTASAMDSINEERNKVLDAQVEQDRATRKQIFQEETKPDTKVRYVPTFVPIQ